MPFGRTRRSATRRTSRRTATPSPTGNSARAISPRCPSAPTDAIYADPPYDVAFTHYSKGGFSWEDQVRAAKFVARHKGPGDSREPGDAAYHRAVQDSWDSTCGSRMLRAASAAPGIANPRAK